MSENNKNLVARLDNQLVMKAHYNLSTNEQKLILFLVSRINPERADFNVQRVKIKEIEKFFMDDGVKRWGSIYERVDMMCNNIMDKKITLPKGFIVNGKPIRMHRYIQWFTDIEPYLGESGEICLKFQFAEPLKKFLLELKEYVRLNLIEVLPMNGKYAIRMYQIFKARYDKSKKHTSVSNITYEIDELKSLLGISNKYKVFQDFKRRVINPLITEINTHSREIKVDYELIKNGRKTQGIKFLVHGKKKGMANIDYVPTSEEIQKLTWAQHNAYDLLINFGVKEGIAYRQILPTIKAANMEGYEDMFLEKALEVFKSKEVKKKSNHDSVAVFVNWWAKKKVFHVKSDLYFQIAEDVHFLIKKKSQTELDNRAIAKTMTKTAFQEWYKQHN